MGDRHQQIVDGATTNYTLDLAAGLTQVLSDDTNTYLYGNGRIAQAGNTTEYFLDDALGSVRQLADIDGAVTLTQSYAPYGKTTSSVGSGASAYQFTGEMRDVSGLTYLRSRYMDSGTGRFISRDTWDGDFNRPLSLNRWNYVEGNPVNYTDPSGYLKEDDNLERAELILSKLNTIYNIQIKKDWGYLYELSNIGNLYIDASLGCEWVEGNWRTLNELDLTLEAVKDMAHKTLATSESGRFAAIMMWRPIRVTRIPTRTVPFIGGGGRAWENYIIFPNAVFNFTDQWAKGLVVHELAHVWDARQNPKNKLSKEMVSVTNAFKEVCIIDPVNVEYCKLVYDPTDGGEKAPTDYVKNSNKPSEDWAESVTAFTYPSWGILRQNRKAYIEKVLNDMFNH